MANEIEVVNRLFPKHRLTHRERIFVQPRRPAIAVPPVRHIGQSRQTKFAPLKNGSRRDSRRCVAKVHRDPAALSDLLTTVRDCRCVHEIGGERFFDKQCVTRIGERDAQRAPLHRWRCHDSKSGFRPGERLRVMREATGVRTERLANPRPRPRIRVYVADDMDTRFAGQDTRPHPPAHPNADKHNRNEIIGRTLTFALALHAAEDSGDSTRMSTNGV